MELIIKYSGPHISFCWEGNKGVEQQLGLSEYTVRAIKKAVGPNLKVIAAKVGQALKGHVWANNASVSVEQHGKRLVACPA